MRAVRVAAVGLGSIAVTTLLAACQRPVPYITLQTGSGSYRVAPQKWCYNPPTQCRNGSNDLRTIVVTAGSTILVDVPGEVAQQRWLVDSFVEQNGRQTTIDAASSGLIANSHSTRVQVPTNFAGESYVLSVQSTNGQHPTGAWGVIVQVHS